MARVKYAEPATIDQEEIFIDLALAAGLNVAEKYRVLFGELFDRIGMYPDSGAPRPSLGRYTRVGFVEPYIIIYRYEAGIVTVLRVLHGRRRLGRRILRG